MKGKIVIFDEADYGIDYNAAYFDKYPVVPLGMVALKVPSKLFS
jgi:hypothetical protein